ncbi:MAG: hypothetical protein WAL98_18265 [Desulfatiglandaceae bacterium]
MALANPQGHPIPLLDELGQPFAIPQTSCDPYRLRILSQNRPDFLHLFIAQSTGTANSFSFNKTGQTSLFEAMDQIFNCSGRIPQKTADLRTAHPLGHHQYTMEAVVIS